MRLLSLRHGLLSASVIALPLLALPVVAGPATASPAPAAAPDVTAAAVDTAPRIVRTPTALTVPAGATSVDVRVRYRCTNTAETTHYLTGLLHQGEGPYYVVGLRGEPRGVLAANCTGQTVAQTLRYVLSTYAVPPVASLQAGAAGLEVALEARGAGGAGWYLTTGPGASRSADVAVRVQ